MSWLICDSIKVNWPADSPRRRLYETKKRRNLYLLPSYLLRLLALPIYVGRQLQKPTPVYAINASGDISPEILCRKQSNYISTGIYRCSILDIDLEFCENFKRSRISADKRFLMYVHYIPFRLTPDRGFCIAVCATKLLFFLCVSIVLPIFFKKTATIIYNVLMTVKNYNYLVLIYYNIYIWLLLSFLLKNTLTNLLSIN